MILKGSQRGGGRALAAHLLNLTDNDHVEVYSIEGLVSTDVKDAFVEIEAISRATRCKQPFFSLSLSPPANEMVTIDDYENAIEQIAETLGLSGQPRVVIFHEKPARAGVQRRHCHVVFSRIETEQMKAINLPFFKTRLNRLSKELYLSHGWALPKGLVDKAMADPLNYTLEEYHVALRTRRDPRELKAVLRSCWERSDSREGFSAALREKGFYLCRGDRRGHVAVHWHNADQIYSLSRWLNEKPKTLTDRLGSLDALPSVTAVRTEIVSLLGNKHQQFLSEVEAAHEQRIQPLNAQRARLVERQRKDRRELVASQLLRRQREAEKHAMRFRRGLLGLWDWASGRRTRIKKQIELERQRGLASDRAEYTALVERHRIEVQPLANAWHRTTKAREKLLSTLMVSPATPATPSVQQKTMHRQIPSIQELDLEL